MFKSLLAFLLVLFWGVSSFAQGTLRGRVSDENGEGIIGGLIFVKENKLKAVNTDLDGNYNIKLEVGVPHTIVISYLGYITIEEKIVIPNNQVVIKNFDLKPNVSQIKEVVVEGKANRAKDNYMEKIKINSATTIDFISSETFKKAGDATVAAAIARVSGVSTNGSFITVRGIGDRYVKTLINGLVVPTLDPLTNNIKLDLFPSSLLDNLFITKSASSDLPGDFAGALISLETKDFPDKLQVNVESTVGYNSQSTFKPFVSSERSSSEWLGYDNNLRGIDHSKFQAVIDEPTVYQQMMTLGLADYYNSLGIDKDTKWTEDYFKLGLVELGLLEKGKFDDAEAINAAKDKFFLNNENRNNAYKSINTKAAEFGKSLPNNWDTRYRIAPLNFSQSFSIGNQVQLFNRPLGVIAGFRYSTAVTSDTVATIRRLQPGDINGAPSFLLDAIQQTTKETNGWSGLIQLNYKFHPNNNIGILFMPNFLGVNNVRTFIDSANSSNVIVSKDQFYEQRKQLVYQVKSEHFIKYLKSKIDFNLSYTSGKSAAPDFKNLQYTLGPNNQNAIGGSFPVRRFYRYLDENLLDSKIKYEMPLFEQPGLTRKLKFGGSYLQSKRDSRQYEYFLGGGPYAALGFENENVRDFFQSEEFNFSNHTNDLGQPEISINKSYLSVDLDSYHTIGVTKIKSGFVMADYTIVPKLRASLGLRVEQTDIYADVYKFDSLGYAAYDERRFQLGDAFMVNPGIIDQVNFLPSVNLIYKLRNQETKPINVRFNYSKTIARPSVRELTETTIYDYEFRSFVFGNSALKTVDIQNYDFRCESYFENGDNVSFSLFYKTFVNHIELVQTSQGFSWQNADLSAVKGIEIDFKKSIIKNLDFKANLTLAQSRTQVTLNNIYVKNGIKVVEAFDTISRQMSGQAPYVINGMLSYTLDSLGITAAIVYNLQGPRLAIVSPQPEVLPDVYEMPRHLIDFKVSKRIGKYFNISISIKDILNSPVRRSYNLPDGYTVDFDNYRIGTNYNLSIGYKF